MNMIWNFVSHTMILGSKVRSPKVNPSPRTMKYNEACGDYPKDLFMRGIWGDSPYPYINNHEHINYEMMWEVFGFYP